MNELIFALHALFITLSSLGALFFGKEALIALIALLAILSNLFVTKQIVLFGLHATPTDALTIGLVCSLNLLQEYYGKEITKRAIGISFGISVIYTVLCHFHLVYLPSIYDTMHTHAVPLLGLMPRIIMASLATYLIVQRFDCFLYEVLKKGCKGKYLVVRNYGSLIISQLLDTVLFSFLGLYGTVESIASIICISYCIKVALIACTTPLLWFSKKIVRVKNYEPLSL